MKPTAVAYYAFCRFTAPCTSLGARCSSATTITRAAPRIMVSSDTLHGRHPSSLAASAFSTASEPSSAQPSSPSSSSFFGFTSGRARRKRRRLLRYQQQQKKINDEAQQSTYDGEGDDGRDQEDTRTVRDILWPSPYRLRGEKEPGMELPRTYEEWKIVLPEAWALYKWTWRGFMTSRGFLVVDELDKVESEKERQEGVVKMEATQEEISAQAKANAEFLKEEAFNLKKQVQERTGIHTKEDLRKWAADMMRLASECVSEFMKGYRKGRDDEVERMLTQYFEELEKEMEKPRRRRAKRRILNRRHPLAR